MQLVGSDKQYLGEEALAASEAEGAKEKALCELAMLYHRTLCPCQRALPRHPIFQKKKKKSSLPTLRTFFAPSLPPLSSASCSSPGSRMAYRSANWPCVYRVEKPARAIRATSRTPQHLNGVHTG